MLWGLLISPCLWYYVVFATVEWRLQYSVFELFAFLNTRNMQI